jgi:hypothetical protein
MIKLWNLNSILSFAFAFAWDYLLILFYYLLWFDIYLHLVTANKILINLLKAMLSFNLYFVDEPYTSHELPPLVSSYTLFPTTCLAMNMCELTLVVSHPHRRRTGGSRGATYRGVRFDLGGISQLTFWRQGWILDPVIFIFYIVRLPLCIKYSDYCDIYLYTLYYYICCLLLRMYEIHPALSLKTRCDTKPHGDKRNGELKWNPITRLKNVSRSTKVSMALRIHPTSKDLKVSPYQ